MHKIALSDGAYVALQAAKRPGESDSDAIGRLVLRKDGQGITARLDDAQAEEFRRILEEEWARTVAGRWDQVSP